LPCVEFALHSQHETSCDSEIQTKEDFKRNFTKQFGRLSIISLNSKDKEEAFDVNVKSRIDEWIEFQENEVEQCNNQRHLFYKDIVLCINCMSMLYLYCKSHLGRE